MKHKLCLILLSSTMLVGCIKETKTVTKESNNKEGNNLDCYYSYYGCNSGGSGGGWNTTGGNTSGSGNTTGWYTTGGNTTGTTSDPDWGNPYPGGVPTGSPCSLTGEGYNPRTANLTSSGKYAYYDPAKTITQSYIGTDNMLKTVPLAKQFFSTDAVLKVRFKALPEPQSAGSGQTLCYGRESGSTSNGYTKMKIWPTVIGLNDSNNNSKSSYYPYPAGIELDVNTCSPAIDLSSYKAMHPHGVYIVIDSVAVNTGANTPYSSYGVPQTKCWSLQFEVAADGTKSFD